jgi:hypothetical protein
MQLAALDGTYASQTSEDSELIYTIFKNSAPATLRLYCKAQSVMLFRGQSGCFSIIGHKQINSEMFTVEAHGTSAWFTGSVTFECKTGFSGG